MRKYEYDFTLMPIGTVDELNRRDAKGWEPISFDTGYGGPNVGVYFRRPITQPVEFIDDEGPTR